MTISAKELLLRQRRFDLIYKYLYVKYPNDAYVRKAYLESIRAFNGFNEVEPSDGVAKDSAEKFCASFNALIDSMRRGGFAAGRGRIPVGDNGEISDGAHRLAVAACLSLEVETEQDGRNDLYDWRFFLNRGMDPKVMDYGALAYVKLQPNSYIVNLHAVTNPKRDDEVETILAKYGFVYYRKEVRPTYNGYVNLKKISYGSFWDREGWIGTPENEFAGAQMHAEKSRGDGRNPLRVYVFVCKDAKDVVTAKAEIRDLYGIGNFSIHINDSREEAIWLAETYFNDHSMEVLNRRPFVYEDPRFDGLVAELRDFVKSRGRAIEDVCAAGSTVLNVLGLRPCDDFDFFAEDDALEVQGATLSRVEPCWQRYYTLPQKEILENPENHFYYHGVKFVKPELLAAMKKVRQSGDKDARDVRMLRGMFVPTLADRLGISHGLAALRAFVFTKKREGDRRRVRILGFIRLSYRRKRK